MGKEIARKRRGKYIHLENDEMEWNVSSIQ